MLLISTIKKRRLSLSTILLSLLLLAPNLYADSPISSKQSQDISSISFLSNFNQLNLIDHHGIPFEPSKLQGRVVLFNFIYTGCHSTCPIQTRALSQVLKQLPADVRSQVNFVSVSIDPKQDSPEKMMAFARSLEADIEGWLFLTGTLKEVGKLSQRLHLLDESLETQNQMPVIHRTSLWLVDKQGRLLQRYKGDPPDQQRLVREISQVSRLHLGKL